MNEQDFFDVLILGAGVAGMSVARALLQQRPRLRVGLISPTPAGVGGSTPWAQGGIAVAWGSDDDPRLHSQDTLAAGAGLCRPEAVDILTREGPERIEELLELGAAFDRDASGQLHLTREAAHSRRRVIHAGDASGRELARSLARALPQQVLAIAGSLTRLWRRGERCVGVELDHQRSLLASHVVLATGGVGQLFAATTNPHGNQGVGLALAYQIGAELRDLEFVQFHPTALDRPGLQGSLPLLTEALRGEGARLVDQSGEPFLHRYHPQAELAPRDVVAFALWSHQQAGHSTLLDARALPVETDFPQVWSLCQRAGLDPARDLLPVTPAVHYHMGGILVDHWGQTGVPGLWACGEVASTGVHGANRLASNSLLEGLVFGHRLGRALAQSSFPVPRQPHAKGGGAGTQNHPLAMQRIQKILWKGLGLARTHSGLSNALQALDRLQERLGDCQGRPPEAMLQAARLMVESALFRQESRGAHRRLDYPQTSPHWQAHTVLEAGQGPRLQSRTESEVHHALVSHSV